MNHNLCRSRRLVAVALAILAISPLEALEVREGRMKLVLHEELGRFSLSFLSDLQKAAYVPLFVDTDPRTSSMTLVADNRVSRLGESADFQQEARRTARGAEFVWRSRVLEVTQSFEFVASASSQLADGVLVKVTIRNLGEQRMQIGLRILLDTYLGEDGTFHFAADGQRQFSREADLTGSARPASWSSTRQNDSSGLGLVVHLSGRGLDGPDRIVFANWQRLNDSSWAYQASANRGFSNLPYSINDSAAAMYWGPRWVEAGGSAGASIVLAASGSGPFQLAADATGQQAAKSAPELLGAIRSTGGIADPSLAAQTDLRMVDELIRSLDARLAAPGTLGDKELEDLRTAAAKLAERIGTYAAERTPGSPRP